MADNTPLAPAHVGRLPDPAANPAHHEPALRRRWSRLPGERCAGGGGGGAGQTGTGWRRRRLQADPSETATQTIATVRVLHTTHYRLLIIIIIIIIIIMLEWPSPTRLFTLLSWYYFATFAMLIGVVSYSFLAS